MTHSFKLAFLSLAVFTVLFGCSSTKTNNGGTSNGSSQTKKQKKKRLFQQADIRIREVTRESGINFTYKNGREAGHRSIVESLGGGLAAIDYDLDTKLDIVIAGGGQWVDKKPAGLPTMLAKNLGNWKFQDVTANASIGKPICYTHGCQIADYNNDGFPDILITGFATLQLFRNQGDGTFVEVQVEAGLNERRWSSSAAFADFNHDGVMDLYVCHYVNWSFKNHPTCNVHDERDVCPPKMFAGTPDSLYFGDGQGGFRDVSKSSGIRDKKWEIESKGLGVIAADVDLDGDTDIYVANDTTRNFLFLNDGKGTFTERAVLYGVAVDLGGGANGSMGLDIGDYDQDGRPDIFVANYEQEPMALYRQDRIGFRHVSGRTGITSIGGLYVGFGTGFVDIELDGDEDVVIANGHVIYFPRNSKVKQEPVLLLNDRTEVDKPTQARFHSAKFEGEQYFTTGHVGRGLVLADFDNNGLTDMAISNNVEPMALLRNETKPLGEWLQVRLYGRTSNRDAIGAVVWAHTDSGKKHVRVSKGGGSYLSQHDPRLMWGFPRGTVIKKLTIKWPSGKTQEVTTGVAVNKQVTVVEEE